MALEIKLKYSVNDTATELVVEDATGAYSVNNLTGWGTPNTERSSIALVLYSTYNGFEQTPENLSLTSPLTPVVLYDALYENTEVSTYTLSYNKDGWYKFYLVAVPTSNVAPIENDIIYDTTLSKLQIYKTSSFVDMVSSDWEFLTDASKYELGFLEDLIVPKLILQRNCQLENIFPVWNVLPCKCNEIKEEYVRLDALIQASDYRFHSSKQSEAQKMTEKLTKDYKCCK